MTASRAAVFRLECLRVCSDPTGDRQVAQQNLYRARKLTSNWRVRKTIGRCVSRQCADRDSNNKSLASSNSVSIFDPKRSLHYAWRVYQFWFAVRGGHSWGCPLQSRARNQSIPFLRLEVLSRIPRILARRATLECGTVELRWTIINRLRSLHRGRSSTNLRGPNRCRRLRRISEFPTSRSPNAAGVSAFHCPGADTGRGLTLAKLHPAQRCRTANRNGTTDTDSTSVRQWIQPVLRLVHAPRWLERPRTLRLRALKQTEISSMPHGWRNERPSRRGPPIYFKIPP